MWLKILKWKVKYLYCCFSRNFGKETAIFAGLEKYIITNIVLFISALLNIVTGVFSLIVLIIMGVQFLSDI